MEVPPSLKKFEDGGGPSVSLKWECIASLWAAISLFVPLDMANVMIGFLAALLRKGQPNNLPCSS